MKIIFHIIFFSLFMSSTSFSNSYIYDYNTKRVLFDEKVQNIKDKKFIKEHEIYLLLYRGNKYNFSNNDNKRIIYFKKELLKDEIKKNNLVEKDNFYRIISRSNRIVSDIYQKKFSNAKKWQYIKVQDQFNSKVVYQKILNINLEVENQLSNDGSLLLIENVNNERFSEVNLRLEISLENKFLRFFSEKKNGVILPVPEDYFIYKKNNLYIDLNNLLKQYNATKFIINEIYIHSKTTKVNESGFSVRLYSYTENPNFFSTKKNNFIQLEKVTSIQDTSETKMNLLSNQKFEYKIKLRHKNNFYKEYLVTDYSFKEPYKKIYLGKINNFKLSDIVVDGTDIIERFNQIFYIYVRENIDQSKIRKPLFYSDFNKNEIDKPNNKPFFKLYSYLKLLTNTFLPFLFLLLIIILVSLLLSIKKNFLLILTPIILISFYKLFSFYFALVISYLLIAIYFIKFFKKKLFLVNFQILITLLIFILFISNLDLFAMIFSYAFIANFILIIALLINSNKGNYFKNLLTNYYFFKKFI